MSHPLRRMLVHGCDRIHPRPSPRLALARRRPSALRPPRPPALGSSAVARPPVAWSTRPPPWSAAWCSPCWPSPRWRWPGRARSRLAPAPRRPRPRRPAAGRPGCWSCSPATRCGRIARRLQPRRRRPALVDHLRRRATDPVRSSRASRPAARRAWPVMTTPGAPQAQPMSCDVAGVGSVRRCVARALLEPRRQGRRLACQPTTAPPSGGAASAWPAGAASPPSSARGGAAGGRQALGRPRAVRPRRRSSPASGSATKNRPVDRRRSSTSSPRPSRSALRLDGAEVTSERDRPGGARAPPRARPGRLRALRQRLQGLRRPWPTSSARSAC